MDNLLIKHHSYKAFLKEYITKYGQLGIIGELAKAAACDRTYFSQVLNGKAQLTPDHAQGLCEYFNFSEAEEDWFHLLVTRERASSARLRNRIDEKLSHLRKTYQNVSKAAVKKSQELDPELIAKYYSEWSYGAIHILCAIKEFQTLDSISRRLILKESKVKTILTDLVNMKLIKKEGQRYIHSGANIHMPHGSSTDLQNHMNWRIKALESYQDLDNVNYTSIFAISKADWPRLKDALLTFISEQREQIGRSGSEECYAFCANLFQI